jgi:hypothetical protein
MPTQTATKLTRGTVRHKEVLRKEKEGTITEEEREQLKQLRAANAAEKRSERAQPKIEVAAKEHTKADEDRMAWDSAGRQLIEQGFNPEDPVVNMIRRKYNSYGAPWSRTKSYFVFRDGDHIDPDILIAWPSEAWESAFGEIARGIDAPDSQTQVHICREMGNALRVPDVQPGETPRQFLQRVWDAWKGCGFKIFNRLGGYLERCGMTTVVKPFGKPFRAFEDSKMEFCVSIKLSSVDDRPIDLKALKPLSGPLLIQV